MEKDKSLYTGQVSISKQEYKEIQERAETFARLTGRVEAFADFANSEVVGGCTMIDIKACAAILGFEVVNSANK